MAKIRRNLYLNPDADARLQAYCDEHSCSYGEALEPLILRLGASSPRGHRPPQKALTDEPRRYIDDTVQAIDTSRRYTDEPKKRTDGHQKPIAMPEPEDFEYEPLQGANYVTRTLNHKRPC